MATVIHKPKYLFRRVASLGVATSLLGLLVLFALIVSFFPDEDAHALMSTFLAMNDSGDWIRPIHFGDTFASPVFLGLVAVLWFALLVSLSLRIRAEIRKRIRLAASYRNDQSTSASPILLAALLELLRRRRYIVQTSQSGELTRLDAMKGNHGIIGSILFHTSLAIILAGLALTVGYSFRGTIVLTEGETFDTQIDEYVRIRSGPMYSPEMRQDFDITLDRVDPEYPVGGAATTCAHITVSGPGGERTTHAVYVNSSASARDQEIHYGSKTGISPAVHIQEPESGLSFRSFVRLAAPKSEETTSYEDFVIMPDGSTYVQLRFLPDPVFRDGAFVSLTNTLTTPLLVVTVTRNADELFSGHIPVGGGANIGGLIISFPEIRRWAQLDIVKDGGSTILLAGTLLASFGLLVRLLSVKKQIKVIIRGQGTEYHAHVSGSTERFHAEFRVEFATIRSDIQLAVLQFEEQKPRIGKEEFKTIYEKTST